MRMRQIVSLECGFSWPPDLLIYNLQTALDLLRPYCTIKCRNGFTALDCELWLM